MRLPFLLLLALPLMADPLFKLYDCKGQESACTGLFPGEAAGWDGGFFGGPFIVDGRTVVNGIDLGSSHHWSPISVDTFTVIYYRDPFVIGWKAYCCDGDTDGHPVKWVLEDDGTATMTEYVGVAGSSPYFLDVNSSGQVIGDRGGADLHPYYDMQDIYGVLSVSTDKPSYVTHPDYPDEFFWYVEKMLRINDNGQAIFIASAPFVDDTRLFLLSPINVPFSDDASSRHMPEPSTGLMVGGLLVCLCAGRRWQMRQRPRSERGAVGGGIACKM